MHAAIVENKVEQAELSEKFSTIKSMVFNFTMIEQRNLPFVYPAAQDVVQNDRRKPRDARSPEIKECVSGMCLS